MYGEVGRFLAMSEELREQRLSNKAPDSQPKAISAKDRYKVTNTQVNGLGSMGGALQKAKPPKGGGAADSTTSQAFYMVTKGC